MANRRNRKSDGGTGATAHTTDAHERDKDFLTEAEIDRILDAAKGEPARRAGSSAHADDVPARVACR